MNFHMLVGIAIEVAKRTKKMASKLSCGRVQSVNSGNHVLIVMSQLSLNQMGAFSTVQYHVNVFVLDHLII